MHQFSYTVNSNPQQNQNSPCFHASPHRSRASTNKGNNKNKILINTLKKNLKVNCKIKWPNDIILNNKKIGGILIESNANFQIIGIGLKALDIIVPVSTFLILKISF